ncbi:HP1A.2 family protein [Megaselia abdita]
MDAEEDYEVEKVVDIRELNGEIGYFVKWKGWPEETNSWVAAKDMMCGELIDEFEKTGKSQLSRKYNPFQRGFQAERIIRAVLDDKNQIFFEIKFYEKERPELVSSKVANVQVTKMVIDYYQQKIEWHPEN